MEYQDTVPKTGHKIEQCLGFWYSPIIILFFRIASRCMVTFLRSKERSH